MILKKTFLFIFIMLISFSVFSADISLLPPKINPISLKEIKKDNVNGYWIEVQVPQRQLLLNKNNKIIASYPIAVGMPDYPTPIDKRKFDRIIWNPWWYPPVSEWVTDPTPVPPRDPNNPLGEMKIPLGRDAYLIHGTKSITSIGGWASHGCVRMLFEDIFSLTNILLNEYSSVDSLKMMEKAELNPDKQMSVRLTRDIPVIISYDIYRYDKDLLYIYPDFYKRHENLVGDTAIKIKDLFPGDYVVNEKKLKRSLKNINDSSLVIKPQQFLSKQ